ncbi:hypothetical protein [Winogradskyella sp. MH6]|uniref:hypothetical protein n=1 Tax=Winogradskyella sp. MH6 TaxID=2929510 RepID=UPI001FB4FCCE|nr:hypothetical protein [Winogradskyella sp. MH6]
MLSLISFLLSFISFSQVTTEVDTTKIRIGEQINYKIKVEADSTALVVFPEGQTFTPLEAVEALEIDTTKKDSKFKLSRIYKLTHFDSGSYTIPRQKIIIGEKPFYTDSLRVDVGTVEVDTTKQKLYDIKPIIEVEKSSSNWWIWLLVVMAALALIGFLLWWFVWREKPLTEEEEIALLPPYDRAKLALKKLDNSQYLIRSEVKEYYSELTMIIRKYLDEKVYERSLESTTDELINRLQLLKEGNQFPFSKETLHNLETILKRADLVKFAKSAPDTALIEMDRATIEKEIESVKAVLPEPTEEEKLLDQQYKEAQERKKKRTKVIITVASLVLLLVATYVGFGLKYGFKYVNDTILRDESKELLEGEWTKSAYGYPPVYIETPEVLKRIQDTLSDESKDKIKQRIFVFDDAEHLDIKIITDEVDSGEQGQEDIQRRVVQSIEKIIEEWETKNVQNIITKDDQFITPNNVEGSKTHGTADFPIKGSDETFEGEYAIFSFATKEGMIAHVTLVWGKEDSYAVDIAERIMNSIEMKSDEQANAEQESQN